MLQFLPALILLLMHGPAGLDELSRTGRLPASLQALVRELRLREPAPTISVLEAVRAEEDSPRPKVAAPVEPIYQAHLPASAVLEPGFIEFQRSRDGPSA